jgi:hypothetical protein
VPKHRCDSRVYRFASDEAVFPDSDGEGSSGYDAGRNETVRRGGYKGDSNARREFGECHSGRRSPRIRGLVFYESEFDAARRQPRVPSSALPSHNGFAKGGIAPVNERYGVKGYLTALHPWTRSWLSLPYARSTTIGRQLIGRHN